MDNGDNIFKEQGRPIKFFIQKDLAENLVEELTVQITTNGGTVEDKVPLQGFVVVEPMSLDGKRLYDCWSKADRPLRSFVPPTFVPACLQAGRLIPQSFRDRSRGERKRIHIHPSIANELLIETLRAAIWNSGGDPTATELEADVIIAEEDNPVFHDLILRYDHTRHQFVEPPAWVKECAETGNYQNTPSVKKNLGGRLKGSRRTEFTEVDDKHLAQYIASRLPDPTMRGRTGNKMYQDLCSRADLYPWAERHPWQSWRERYKNNVQRFTHLIDSFVKLNPMSIDGKGLHGFVRASTSLPAKSSQIDRKPTSDGSKVEVNVPLDSEWEGSQWEIRVGRSSPPVWGKGKRKAEDHGKGPEKRVRTRVKSDDNAQGQTAPAQSSVPPKGDSLASNLPLDAAETGKVVVQYPVDGTKLRSLTRSRSPDRNVQNPEASPAASSPTQPESDDADIGTETQMLLTAHQEMLMGTRSPRKPSEIGAVKPESTDFLVPQSQLPGKAKLDPATAITPKAPDAGQMLVQIACKYRFVLEEVKEVYEELTYDLDRTKAFFEEARQNLTEKRTTWKLIAGRVTREFEKDD